MEDSNVNLAQEELNVEALIKSGNRLGGKNGEEVRKRIIHKYTKDMVKDMDELREDYLSPAAQEKIAFYEKVVYLMEVFQEGDIANLAADLGDIFRRRKEIDKSLKYYEISMMHYDIAGNMTCYLMELTDVADALEKLGQRARAISILRMGLRKAVEAKKEVMDVCIAQQLSTILVKADNEQYRDEILKCFDIEEKYVRSVGTPSEIAKFLYCKLTYLKREELNVWKPILEEFGRIIKDNGLKEFEHGLIELENVAKKKEEYAAVGKGKSLKEVVELITELLPQDNKFIITKTSENTEKYYVTCEPENESAQESELWYFLVDKGDASEINVVIQYMPISCSEKALELIKNYNKWWTNQLLYGLRYDEEKKCIDAVLSVKAESREKIIKLFNYQRKLWEVDKANFLMLSMDYCDIDMCKELKKRAMKSE